MYENIESLSLTLQENEYKRQEFEQMRQNWDGYGDCHTVIMQS
ncbi:hypothetical protein ACSVC9_05025 [Clostridium sp. LBM24168]